MGNLLFVKVHAANIHDTVSGSAVFSGALAKYPSIKGVCADAGYRKTFENAVKALGKTVTISEKIKPKQWAVLPKRWIVERTLSWLGHSRRLAKDFEISVDSEETMVMISHTATLLNRFSPL
jgi:transposase